MKKFLLVFALVSTLITIKASAQRDTVLLYMKGSGSEYSLYPDADLPAMKKEDATFIRVLISPENDNGLYRVNDYYLNGKLKFSGESLLPGWNIRLQGTCVAYFENGHKKCIYNYDRGKLTGDVIAYFPNGRVNTIKSINDGQIVNDTGMPTLTLKQCLDSLGNVLTDSGNGKWIEYHGRNTPFAEGMVKNGVEDGEWHGRINDTTNYSCIYSMGLLKEGKSTVTSGNVYTFSQIQSLPEFPGGTQKFAAFLGKTLVYTADARQNKIQGKVIVRFTVKKDGSLTDMKIVKSLYPSLDEQALNALQKSPKWKPGYKYGIKTDVYYTVPVSFALAYDN
ncbi:MAG TPA: TonB family protein [Mucilaginibacter sp.]